MDSAILLGVNDVFILGFPFIICEEMLIGDGVDVGVMRGFDRRLNEVGLMSFGVDGKGTEKFLGLV